MSVTVVGNADSRNLSQYKFASDKENLCMFLSIFSSFRITFANSADREERQIKFEIRKLRHLDIYLSAEIPFRYETNICPGMARETSTNSVHNAL